MANPQQLGMAQNQGFGFGSPVMNNGFGSPVMNNGANHAGVVMCFLCGKQGHYARNCWAAGNGRPTLGLQQQDTQGTDEITNEMKAYFRKKIQKQKKEEEKREEEYEEKKRREEESRKEADRIREFEAREARLEAKLVRLLTQHWKPTDNSMPSGPRKKSPRTKARVLREMRSYFDESEDDSEEVREEAGKLIEAIESPKGKKRVPEWEGRISAARMRPARAAVVINVEDDLPGMMHTPQPKRKDANNGAAGGEMLEYVLGLHRQLSAKKVPELRKICNQEGIEWTKKEVAITELVRCRTRLAYNEFAEPSQASPLSGK
ncbi:hypothetical protein CBR_g46873 [Chara braunii]|uniref:CCHC-type domain-containing protein n=1 Tax=Chara braunii TaxID=69332 RepID=A0A388M183_CHABU|nr:hypothetical protein CBR_g46873 [Chara braunii]|eukprot:GBG88306.1 hypothetical protein CBR_g46873 [Chara braunii]